MNNRQENKVNIFYLDKKEEFCSKKEYTADESYSEVYVLLESTSILDENGKSMVD